MPIATTGPLRDTPTSELELELHLRRGPKYQCHSSICRSYEDGPGIWNTCPSCGKEGYLCGSFKLDVESLQYKSWVRRTFKKYRGVENKAKEKTMLKDDLDNFIDLLAVASTVYHTPEELRFLEKLEDRHGVLEDVGMWLSDEERDRLEEIAARADDLLEESPATPTIDSHLSDSGRLRDGECSESLDEGSSRRLPSMEE